MTLVDFLSNSDMSLTTICFTLLLESLSEHGNRSGGQKNKELLQDTYPHGRKVVRRKVYDQAIHNNYSLCIQSGTSTQLPLFIINIS